MKKRSDIHRDYRPFRELVLGLFRNYESETRKLTGLRGSTHQSLVAQVTAFGFPPIDNDRLLESILPSKAKSLIDLSRSRRFLYLEPIIQGGHFLPVMSFIGEFRTLKPELRLRVALFLLDSTEKLRAVGYRFETPEGPGRHSYYHAQPIITFRDGSPQLPCPNWLSTDHPTLPLDAVDPVTLLLALLISLYGYRYFTEKVSPWLGGISPYYSKKMRCTST